MTNKHKTKFTARRPAMRILAVLGVVGTLSASATAAPSELAGWYATGDIGIANFSQSGSDDDDTTFSVGLGYALMPNVAAEFSFRSLGKPGSVSISAIQASLVGSMPVQGRLGAYGRLGFGRVDADDAYWRLAFGFGAQYDWTPQVRVRAGYERYAKIEGVSTSLWTAGVVYRF